MGGFPIGGSSILIRPFLSFLGPPRFFWKASDSLQDFPDLSLSSFSAYLKHLQGIFPKGSATQSGPFTRKKGKPPVWKKAKNSSKRKKARKSQAQKLRERNSCETLRQHGRKMRRKFGDIFRRFSSFNFQEKWAQEISKKIGGKFHEPGKKILSPRDFGSLGAQQLLVTVGGKNKPRRVGGSGSRFGLSLSLSSLAVLFQKPSSSLSLAVLFQQPSFSVSISRRGPLPHPAGNSQALT